MTAADTLDGLYAGHVTDLRVRYAKVIERLGWDAIVLHCGSPVMRSAFDDQYWPLRPVPHWQHWLPLVEADAALVVRADQRPTLIRVTEQSFWEKRPSPESDAFLNQFDVVEVSDTAATRSYAGSGRVAFVGEDGARAATWGIAPEQVCPPSLMLALDELRTTKTAYEVACIAEANRRARAGHEALREVFAGGCASEFDLHLRYLQATAQDDWETPYKNIVALGPNAATLHHVAYARSPTKGEVESLLVDAGATCRGYASDITRTWVRGAGARASAFAQIVAGVDAMQARLCAAVGVGAAYEDLHDRSHREVAAILREAGLVRASIDEAVETGVTRAFFPHGLGHSLGLQTHDVGCGLRPPKPENPYLRNTSEVTAGQVFTIEPGIYFIRQLLDPLREGAGRRIVDFAAVDALASLGGVRIEDDLFVTGGDSVVRNLTREQLPSGGGAV